MKTEKSKPPSSLKFGDREEILSLFRTSLVAKTKKVEEIDDVVEALKVETVLLKTLALLWDLEERVKPPSSDGDETGVDFDEARREIITKISTISLGKAN